MIFIRLLAVTAMLLSTVLPSLAQDSGKRSYELKFLAAKYLDTTTTPEYLLVFRYTPKPGKPFKPVFSMKMAYQLEGQPDLKTELLDTGGHSITFYGPDVNKKSPFIYGLIREQIEAETLPAFGIIVFQLRNLSSGYVSKMRFRYGLWEPENTDLRFEEDYQVAVLR